MSEAKKKLWACIQRKELGGYKFIRQYAIGDYIVNFACVSRKFSKNRRIISLIKALVMRSAHNIYWLKGGYFFAIRMKIFLGALIVLLTIFMHILRIGHNYE